MKAERKGKFFMVYLDDWYLEVSNKHHISHRFAKEGKDIYFPQLPII